jgi:hypothetical protein
MSKVYQHKRLGRDNYLGRVANMPSFGHGGAALLLLILPASAEQAEQKKTAAEE